MKSKFICLCVSAFLLALPVRGAEKMDLPKVESFSLSNGVKVLYIHDELPRITVAAMVASGFLYEKSETAGITEMTAKALSFCGTNKYPGRSLAEYIDSTGSRFSVSPDWESVTVSYQALDEFTEDAFSVTGGILIDPPVQDGNVALAKHLMKEKISREKEDPMMAAYLAARKLVFGDTSYGIRATAATVDAISIDGLKNHWRYAVKSGNIVIGIASSRSLAEIKQLAEKYYGSVPTGERQMYLSDRKSEYETAEKNAGKIYYIRRDIPQSTIVMLSPAPDMHDATADSLDVADQILGGGDFNSKLVQEIREKRGLAYGAGSIIRKRDRTGLFMAYAQCDNARAGEVVSLMRG
ncbi:MAG TPA: pitrilysin family protein, partial [Spirochaetota bacterium]|nr:pitrilysin family protein [Spirochaetota bacterium]